MSVVWSSLAVWAGGLAVVAPVTPSGNGQAGALLSGCVTAWDLRNGDRSFQKHGIDCRTAMTCDMGLGLGLGHQKA
jgi:hypothetical protein